MIQRPVWTTYAGPSALVFEDARGWSFYFSGKSLVGYRRPGRLPVVSGDFLPLALQRLHLDAIDGGSPEALARRVGDAQFETQLASELDRSGWRLEDVS